MNSHVNIEVRTALASLFSELADALMAGQTTRIEATRTPIFVGAQRTSPRLTTQWPKLSVDSGQKSPWDVTHLGERFIPGETVYFYAAGCTGLAHLGRQLQLPLFKLGLSQQSNLLIRQQELRTDCYGSAFKRDGQYESQPGFDDWEMRQIEPNVPDLPLITATQRALQIVLPESLPYKQFERQLDAELAPISLSSWINTRHGQAHLAELPVDPAIADRFTAYGFGEANRLSRAGEICICRPREDLAKIAVLVSRILRDHLAAQPVAPL